MKTDQTRIEAAKSRLSKTLTERHLYPYLGSMREDDEGEIVCCLDGTTYSVSDLKAIVAALEGERPIYSFHRVSTPEALSSDTDR